MTATVPTSVKVVLPIVATTALWLGAGSWHTAMSNEHRLTDMEVTIAMVDKSLNEMKAHEMLVEQSLSRVGELLAKIEGAMEEQRTTALTTHAESQRDTRQLFRENQQMFKEHKGVKKP